MNSVSFFISLLLHMGLVLLVLLWPASKPLDLKREVYQVSLVMGAPGGENLPSPVLGARALAADKPNASLSQPVEAKTPVEAAPSAAQVLSPDAPPPLPQAAQALAPNAVPPPPVPVPVPPPPASVPVPPKDAAVPQIPRQEAVEPPKPKEPPKPVEPPKPKEPPKPVEKPAEKPADKPKPKEPPARDVLADALNTAKNQAGSKKPNQNTGKDTGARRSSAANALADLQKQVGVGGGGGQGDGPGGGGIYDAYTGLIARMVQPNWSTAIYGRENITVQLRIVVDDQGNVQDCTVARSSGRPDFDASAQNAVVRTALLPAPPTPEFREILINFNSQDGVGR